MSSLRRPPGPRGRTLLGVTPLTSGNSLRSAYRMVRKLTATFTLPAFFAITSIFLNRPELHRADAGGQNSKFIKGRALQANRELFGNVC